MTKREQLAQDYPLHYQRIIEIIFEQDLLDTERQLKSPADRLGIQCLFAWGMTHEGHRYWKALNHE